MAACERIFKLLDTPTEIVSPEAAKAGDGSNRIEFRHVWFTYQTLTDEQKAMVAAATPAELTAMADIEWILKDVSFIVEPGQTVAIVGHTGSGKTTLTRLAVRLWDVDRGSVTLGGIDLRALPLDALMQRIACVFQDVALLDDTIAANLKLGRPEASDEEMMLAAAAGRFSSTLTSVARTSRPPKKKLAKKSTDAKR